MKRTRLPILVLCLAAAAASQDRADDHLALGKMWTFENPPLAYLEQEYGFKPDQKWLDTLRLSALRLGERDNPWCSAAFVSPKGLIMTNHHCVRDPVAKLGMAKGKPELVDTGFAAKALEDEVQLEGLTVQQLVEQQDVTQAVDQGIEAGDDDQTIAQKRAANTAQVLKDAEAKHPDRKHQVVTLWQGAAHQLYSYRIWDDVRLVMAVNLQTAHFGGDPDNFTFPRWSIDFSFVRAYEDGKPADTSAHYFRWRQNGAHDGDLVFVPGNPGSTNRLFTTPQLEYQRDVEYPLIHGQLGNGMAILRPWAERNPGIKTTLLNWENSYKAIGGMLAGLRDPVLMARKREHEQRFQAAVAADPKLQAAFGGAWPKLADLAARKRELKPRTEFYQASYSTVLERALAIVKSVDAGLTDEERQEARMQAIGVRMFGNEITEALLVDHFVRAAKWLGKDDPYVRAVAGPQAGQESVDWAAALEALAASKLGNARVTKRLLDGGAEAVAASDDPGLAVARVLWPLQRDVEKAAKEVDNAIEVQGALIGKALHAVYGSRVSPDATMTLRFSDGRVQGYEYNGTLAPWSTCFYGLYGRASEFGNVFPFQLAQPWIDAEPRIDMQKRVCFVSTNDIVGGNSGSSVVDKDLQVVGLIFDGNIESLPSDFYYTQEKARAVSVHTDAIVEALTKVYDLPRIVEELRSEAPAPARGEK
jgi:hypothetical protein